MSRAYAFPISPTRSIRHPVRGGWFHHWKDSSVRILGGMAAVLGLFVLVSCQDDDAVSSNAKDGTRQIVLRLERSTVLPDSIWYGTDSVRVVVVTTSGASVADEFVGFHYGAHSLDSVRVPAGEAVEIKVAGNDHDVVTWTASTAMPPSAQGQIATLSAISGKSSIMGASSLGVLVAPAVKSISPSAMKTDSDGVKVYSAPVKLLLLERADSATVRYTLDGTAPEGGGRIYKPDSGIRIDSSCVLRAVATKIGWTSSVMLVEAIRIHPLLVSGVALSVRPWLDTNTFDRSVTVKLATRAENAEIRYTLDGSEPMRASPLYTSAGVLIDSSRTMKAVVFDEEFHRGDLVWTRSFVLKARPVRFSVEERVVSFGVAMSCSTSGVVIRYRLDGASPANSDSVYRDSLEFGPYDDSANVAAVATPLDAKIQPSSVVRRMIGPELPWNTGVVYDTFHDSRDGQVYRTVKIAGHRWMAQNLNFKTETSGCYEGNPNHCLRYGRLYSWAETMGLSSGFDTTRWSGGAPRRGICPSGWHVPNDSEWAVLVDSSGSVSSGMTLRASRGWLIGGGSDRYGFRALPSGRRYDNETFVYAGSSAYFWTASESDAYSAFGRYICSGCGRMYRTDFSKSYGFGVRCSED